MPPARPRNIDDSRSETSSTITNQKEKSTLPPTSVSGVLKGKRSQTSHNGPGGGGNKSAVAGPPAPSTTTAEETEKDANQPQTDWASVPTSILRTYRIAHRLPVPAAFNHPHAELTFSSSKIALRAPSVVAYRRKLRDQKHQRRKLRQTQQANGAAKSTTTSTKSKDKEKGKLKDPSHTEKPSSTNPSIAQSIEPLDQEVSPSSPSTASTTTNLSRREPASHLATAVRKHFNAQQLNEPDMIARFIYVVQQNGRAVRTEGSGGDGSGSWMGSHGRAVRRLDGPGGEVGFRLRFRP